MNVFIMTDLEGITNVNSITAITDKDDYRLACEELMKDVNAAVDGYFDAGAERVFVFDGHGAGVNFIKEMLDPRAEQLSIENWQSVIINKEVDICAEIGLHAMAGTINGFLDHTQTSLKWFSYHVNSQPRGEVFQGAAFYGAYDIPMVMVSGDVAACKEARELLGDIAIAPVKEGVGRNKAVSLPTEEARKMIYDAAKASVDLKDKIKPYKLALPATVEITFTRSDYCESYLEKKEAERIDARTIRKTVDKIVNYHDIM